jgi:hypothetical protein
MTEKQVPEYMASKPMTEKVDVLVVGSGRFPFRKITTYFSRRAGHNGLVCSTFLSRRGLKVLVVEEKDTIGGCTRTEYPFKNAPGVGASTGAYLLGLMPPELVQKLGIEIPTIRRDPHYFLPTIGYRIDC